MTTQTIQQSLERAVQHHQAGRLNEAEPLYRQILERDPNQPDALHMLGVLAHQTGHHQLSADMIGRAIQINSSVAAYHSNYGLAMVTLNRKDTAIAAYRQALALRPNYPEAHNNLGIVLYSLGQYDAAIQHYTRAIGLKPDYIDAYHNFADALAAKGQTEEAIEYYRRAIAGKPNWPEAYNNLGNALYAVQRYDEAIDAYRQAVSLAPNFPGAYGNLGNSFAAKGKLKQAIEFHRKAVSLQPTLAEAQFNLGNALQDSGQTVDAIACFRKAAELNPQNAIFLGNLGAALYNQGKLDEAIAVFNEAVALKPEFEQTRYNLANAQHGKGMVQEAINGYRQALALRPNWAMALNNLGNAFKDFGQLDEAMDCYRRALVDDPENILAHRNWLYSMHFHPAYDAERILREQRKWDETIIRSPKQSAPLIDNDPDPDRKLKIGYISPDFREHVVGQNLLPLIKNHDRRNFEIFCYAAVIFPDAVTEQFKSSADHWRNILHKSDDDAAKMIHEDKIDIVVDLALHLAANRLTILARRPAPVQVVFGGYPGGSGMSTIDYRLGDPYLDPPEADSHYAEKVIRLPHSFWCYDPVAMGVLDIPEPTPPPAMEKGFVTFGCLNNFAKVNESVLIAWARVLNAVPKSHLLLLSPQGDARNHVRTFLGDYGIESSRIEFVDRQDRLVYFDMYRRIDIGLDTFPYNGHTTSLDSFWMGVPVVTLVGDTVVGRAGWSQLSNLNLTELAGRTPEQFVEIAVSLANDLPRLGRLRSSLRQKMLDSPLTDAVKFAQGIESAYRLIWRQWCASGKH